MIYLWYAYKCIVAKTVHFFSGSLIYIFVGTGAGLLLIFIGIFIFVIRRKRKQAHAMTDMKDNSSTDFSKNFFERFVKKKRLNFSFTTKMYFCIKL